MQIFKFKKLIKKKIYGIIFLINLIFSLTFLKFLIKNTTNPEL